MEMLLEHFKKIHSRTVKPCNSIMDMNFMFYSVRAISYHFFTDNFNGLELNCTVKIFPVLFFFPEKGSEIKALFHSFF